MTLKLFYLNDLRYPAVCASASELKYTAFAEFI